MDQSSHPHVLARRKRIEDLLGPRVKNRNVKHEHWIVRTPPPPKPFPEFHRANCRRLVVFIFDSFQRAKTKRQSRPNKIPMKGLSTANQSETRHSAIGRGLFMVMTCVVRRIDVSAEEIDNQCHSQDGNRVHGRCAVIKTKAGGDEGARLSRNFLCA